MALISRVFTLKPGETHKNMRELVRTACVASSGCYLLAYSASQHTDIFNFFPPK